MNNKELKGIKIKFGTSEESKSGNCTGSEY